VVRGGAFAATAALAAALLSAAYVVVYLRGGPRIIDATSYWLEARGIAAGHLAWPLDEPASAILGRFLVRSDASSPQATAGSGASGVAVIFPPGYPAVLALGFLAGAPLAIGPLLAAALAVATYDLAARVPAGTGSASVSAIPFVPSLAALFSVVCAALRYHTADTMSHGLAALCFTVALTFALRALDRAAAPNAGGTAKADPRPTSKRWSAARFAAMAGLAAGWLAATRPPSALALAAVLVALLLCDTPDEAHRPAPPGARLRIAAAMALGALPGLALLVAHQRAATGAWTSSQALYYAVADGPPGCFRYGFGAGIGCLGEHGDFVRHNLANGYDLLAAAGTTLRRLKLHLVDPLNAEPLTLLVLAGAAIAARRPRARMLAFAPLLQIAAYAPFYFDGNYPGGGARFYADVLPIEHVLAAIAVAALARRASPRREPPPHSNWLAFAVALPLAGFAVRAGFDHALLRDRDGGLPMFDPAAAARAGISRGLLFIDTDHGFNLGFDPASLPVEGDRSGGLSPSRVDVLRYHGDALDRMAWETRGRPPAFRYRFEIPERGGPASVSITPLLLDENPDERVIEGESLWPPIAQRNAWALPEHAGATCASASRWLTVHAATRGGEALVRVRLPAPWLRGAELSPRLATAGDVSGAIHLLVDGAEIHVWPAPPGRPSPPACSALPHYPIPATAARVELALERRSGGIGGTARVEVESGSGSENESDLFALDAVSVRGGKTVDR
jgi:hypothetical protein